MIIEQHRIVTSTIADYLLTTADRHPQRPLLIFPDQQHTYASLIEAAYLHARSLHALGVGNGDVVGILMANCMEYKELLIAGALLGAVVVPMNARYKSSELAYVIENADINVLVTHDLISEYADFGELVTGSFPAIATHSGDKPLQLDQAPQLNHVVMLGDRQQPGFLSQQEYTNLAKHVSKPAIDELRVRVQVEQPAIMMYTSGTTANPKGCPLSHALLVRNSVNMNRERYFLTEQDVFWSPLPMFHMSSVLPFLCCIDAGAAMSSMTHFEAGQALQMLQRDQVSIAFPAFPTVTNALVSHPEFKSTNLSNLRRINNVAPIDMLKRFQEAFPQAVQTGAYGLTEAGGVIAYNHPDEDLQTRLTTCGKPFPGVDVKIVNPQTLQELAVGERGEILIKGYCVFDGYHKAPDKNAEAFVDGWFRTGDLCSVTDSGSICFHGRIKDMLKVGGENVAALEIESFLAKHPAVQLAQVIGREDDRLQEVPIAFIELVPGESATSDELIAFCKQDLASFKVPREIHFVEEWPMSSTKVQKFKLKEMLQSSFT